MSNAEEMGVGGERIPSSDVMRSAKSKDGAISKEKSMVKPVAVSVISEPVAAVSMALRVTEQVALTRRRGIS